MGRSIDLYSFDYEKLKNKILTNYNTENVELVEKILKSCGSRIADRYILLDQDFWEDMNCYFNLEEILDKAFNVEYCQSIFDKDVDRVELVSANEVYEVLSELEIEY